MLVAVATGRFASGQDATASRTSENPEVVTPTADVEIDGTVLFRVRGFSSLPAEQRAAGIVSRIEAIASDPVFDPGTLRAVDLDGMLQIRAGERFVMSVFDSDGRLEGVSKIVLANAHVKRIGEAILQYREARKRPALVRGAAISAGVLVAFVFAAWLVIRSFRKLSALLEGRYRQRLRSVGVQSFEIVRVERVWEALNGALRLIKTVALVTLAVLALDAVLGLFPWTRPIAQRLTGVLVRPLGVLFHSFLATLPDLIFLTVLFFVVRYLLRLLRLFFEAIERKTVSFAGFEPEWALPTYKIARVAVAAFAIVVAYPYIPGSGSAAFKGVSLFLGIVFSLGSTSFISNTVAGYSMTYRRAFRVGDRVRIGDVVGDVTEVRLQVTHIRTPKNEEVTVPNSQILGSNVVNYSRLAKEPGLILHTTVGIGYETPWRQVEAMLLLAAERSPGLLKEPPPFVLQTALGDFCVTYEINVYCDAPHRMPALYAELHRQILDVFNEYGVQIMTPAYEGDTAQPKVVPKDQWFLAPAHSSHAGDRQ